jgi:hypothetical protein
MSTIRVRQVADGEELVLAEEFYEARLSLGQIDPRAVILERRDNALTAVPPARKPRGASADRLRAKTHEWAR